MGHPKIIIKTLEKSGVQLFFKRDMLQFSAKNGISTDELRLIRKNKPEIISFLKREYIEPANDAELFLCNKETKEAFKIDEGGRTQCLSCKNYAIVRVYNRTKRAKVSMRGCKISQDAIVSECEWHRCPDWFDNGHSIPDSEIMSRQKAATGIEIVPATGWGDKAKNCKEKSIKPVINTRKEHAMMTIKQEWQRDDEPF